MLQVEFTHTEETWREEDIQETCAEVGFESGWAEEMERLIKQQNEDQR